MSITAVPISIRDVRAPTAASSGNGEPSCRAKWCTRKYAPSAPSSSAATASSSDWISASDAERTCDAGDSDQWPNERNPIFFTRASSPIATYAPGRSREAGGRASPQALRGSAGAGSRLLRGLERARPGTRMQSKRDERLFHTTVRSRRRRRRRRDRCRPGRPCHRPGSDGPGTSAPDPRARRRGRSRLARALGLADPLHAAPLQRAARLGFPWRSRRLPDPRRGDRLPRALRRDLRASGQAERRGRASSGVATTAASASTSKEGSSWPTRSSSPPGRSRRPTCPGSAEKLAADVFQTHAVGYGRPADVPDGTILVVGGGNTGFQIAKELSATHEVVLSIGSPQKPLPQRPLGRDLFWWLTKARVLNKTVESRLGRKLSTRDTLIGSSPREMTKRYGVELKPRLVDADGRRVWFEGGGELDVDAVVWATGYRPDYSWIDVADLRRDRSPTPPPRGDRGSRFLLPGSILAAHPRLGSHRLGRRGRRLRRR